MATTQSMEEYYSIFRACSIFDGIPEEKYPQILRCLSGYSKSFKCGHTILNIGEISQMAGIVLEGKIELAYYDENGSQVNLDHICAGQVFGAERACCDCCVSPLQLRALTNCTVLFLNFSNLLQVTENHCPYRAHVTRNLLKDFARQTQFMGLRMRIISQKKLRDKLKIYLQTLDVDENGQIQLPFTRHELADYLYADRSALSRELCRMRDEGLLTFEGKQVYMKDKDFLKN